MRLIGWAIALAAAGLTPAAAQTPATSPATNGAAAAAPAAAAAAPAATPATAAPIQYGTVGHAIPKEGVGMPTPGGIDIQPQVTHLGERAAHFHNFWLMIVITFISIFVLVLLAWTMFRYRRGANPTPSRNSHNTLIEVIWTVVPVAILAAIAIPSIILLRDQYTPPPADVTVKITGHQWYWTYEYPDYGVSFDSNILKEKGDPTLKPGDRYRDPAGRDGPPLLAADERMVIPAGKVVKFIITADDVIHSFAVPAFWIKQDANPGQLHETWAKVDRPGVYFGQCSELCGARHGYMPIGVEVTSPTQFAAWVASKGGHMPGTQPAAAATPAAASAAPAPAAAQPAAAPQQPATNQAATAQN